MSLVDLKPFLEQERANVAAGVAEVLHDLARGREPQKTAEIRQFSHTGGESVATVATVAGPLDLSASWKQAMTAMRRADASRHWPRWRQLAADAEQFAMSWGTAAPDLGWDVPTAFGFDPYDDALGLIAQMRGCPVVALVPAADGKPAEAIIKRGPDTYRFCRARVSEETIMLWRWRDADFLPP